MEETIELKYFVPEIEDIRVGYECEVFGHSFLRGLTFIPVIVELGMLKNDWKQYIIDDKVRVPYLTKEQIEKEGWNYEGSMTNSPIHDFKNGLWYIIYSEQSRILEIYLHNQDILDAEMTTLFYGKCKDINTFRYICKLLGI